jgi:hypothetical protein
MQLPTLCHARAAQIYIYGLVGSGSGRSRVNESHCQTRDQFSINHAARGSVTNCTLNEKCETRMVGRAPPCTLSGCR